MTQDPSPNNTNQSLASLMAALKQNIALSKKKSTIYPDYQEYFEPLKHHGIPPSHPLYDIAFYLLCSSIIQDHKGTPEDLAPILEVWGSLERPSIWVFHAPYVVPEFWEPHFRAQHVRQHFSKYFQKWIDRPTSLTWVDFATDLQTYFTHAPPSLTPSQFSTLIAMLHYQTESIKELSKRLNRSEESISRDKKALFEKRAVHKSIWIDFSKLYLTQRTLILFHQPRKGYRALVPPDNPWLYSQTVAYMLNRYSVLTFLIPDDRSVFQTLETLKEQFVNTSDVSEALLFEPDFTTSPPIFTINYQGFDPKSQRWEFDVGFPLSNIRLREPSNDVIYISVKKRSQITFSEDSDAKPSQYSQEFMRAIDLILKKGWQSIRQLKEQLDTSFHRARKILNQIRENEICYERFTATLGSTLSTLFLIIQNPSQETISRLTTFLTYLPEQITTHVKGDFTGIVSYIRVPHEYQQETIHAIETLVSPDHVLALPLIGSSDIRWNFPWERWDETMQQWIAKNEDFTIIDY